MAMPIAAYRSDHWRKSTLEYINDSSHRGGPHERHVDKRDQHRRDAWRIGSVKPAMQRGQLSASGIRIARESNQRTRRRVSCHRGDDALVQRTRDNGHVRYAGCVKRV